MPILVPADPLFGDGGRGERAVWDVLRDQLPGEAVLFHGLRLQERQREYEADLVVLFPGAGWAVIEVKGGDVRRHQGNWEQRQQGVWQQIDPVGQAQDCRHVLQRYLARHGSQAEHSRAVHLVALPDREVDDDFEAPGLPRQLLIDRQDLKQATHQVLRALELHGEGAAPLSLSGTTEMFQLLTGPDLTSADIFAFHAEHEERVRQMTQDQTSILGFLRHQQRAAVVGGAGSGKTWLALEQARRLAKDGQAVALVCYSRGLARFLQRVTAQWRRPRERPSYVGLFHDLPVQWGAPRGEEDDSVWFEEKLPALLGRLAAERPVADRFDSIVVDEGQDFSASWWPPTLLALKDPDAGGLYVFLDEGQRVFDRLGATPIELAPFPLDRNIRNTKRIAQVFGSLCLEQPKYAGLEGPPVRFVACRTDDAVQAADTEVERLTDVDGWPPGSVALLTTKHRHPVQTDAVERGGWDAYWDDFFAGEDVFYGHVLGFKGLERPVVVLAVNGFRDVSRAREMLYVGLSRARFQLVVCGDLALISDVGGEGVRHRLTGARD
jgi:Nuclease-related domain/UvrD-like helicase C-terminal domain/PhoH-like protein